MTEMTKRKIASVELYKTNRSVFPFTISQEPAQARTQVQV